jgi:hypothetical protein
MPFANRRLVQAINTALSGSEKRRGIAPAAVFPPYGSSLAVIGAAENQSALPSNVAWQNVLANIQ